MATMSLLTQADATGLLSRSTTGGSMMGAHPPGSPAYGQPSSPLSSADWSSLLAQAGTGSFSGLASSPQMQNSGLQAAGFGGNQSSPLLMSNPAADLSPASYSADSNAFIMSAGTNQLLQAYSSGDSGVQALYSTSEQVAMAAKLAAMQQQQQQQQQQTQAAVQQSLAGLNGLSVSPGLARTSLELASAFAPPKQMSSSLYIKVCALH